VLDTQRDVWTSSLVASYITWAASTVVAISVVVNNSVAVRSSRPGGFRRVTCSASLADTERRLAPMRWSEMNPT
jgi:hypothetical protein